MGAQKWFKFYGQEYLSDPKIGRLTPQERSCWVTLLCIASMSDGVVKFLTVEDLLQKAGIVWDPYCPDEWERGLGVLNKFQNLEMISCSENGDIMILNWEKRQETNLTGAERVRNFRERQKNKENKGQNGDVTRKVTKVTLDKNRIDKNREEDSPESDGLPTADDSEKKSLKKPKFTDEDLRLANLLAELIKINNPEWEMRGKIETWAEHIEKLHRIDKREYRQIEWMIKWVQHDAFWKQNILSTEKLREKFNDLIPKAKAAVAKAQTEQLQANKRKVA